MYVQVHTSYKRHFFNKKLLEISMHAIRINEKQLEHIKNTVFKRCQTVLISLLQQKAYKMGHK